MVAGRLAGLAAPAIAATILATRAICAYQRSI